MPDIYMVYESPVAGMLTLMILAGLMTSVARSEQGGEMALKTDRRTVNLSAFPDLVVIYLGMRVNKPRGLRTLLRFGPKIAKSVADQPDGLLLHENMRDTGGTGFWHELYFMRGGMEAVYLDIADHPLGFLNFAPAEPARGAMFSARSRLKAGGETKMAVPVSEEELYDRG
jgi:hypothetical protein